MAGSWDGYQKPKSRQGHAIAYIPEGEAQMSDLETIVEIGKICCDQARTPGHVGVGARAAIIALEEEVERLNTTNESVILEKQIEQLHEENKRLNNELDISRKKVKQLGLDNLGLSENIDRRVHIRLDKLLDEIGVGNKRDGAKTRIKKLLDECDRLNGENTRLKADIEKVQTLIKGRKNEQTYPT